MRDLLRDEYFIKLVKNPDADTEHYWYRWLEGHPERKEDFELAKQLIQSLKYKKTNKLSELDYDRMFIQIKTFKQLDDKKEYRYMSSNKRKLFGLIVRAAAVILFIVSFAFGVVYLIPENVPNSLSSNVELIKKNVPIGVKRTIFLSDGTRVRLNAGSQLEFPKQFSHDRRTVELKGEAYFDVAKDKNRPFIIKSDHIFTEVLGTSFNVRCIRDENNIEVALVSGKVKVNNALGGVITLKPSEMAVYSKITKTFHKKRFSIRSITGWKDNILIFEKASMQQIVDKLEQWYGVRIELDLSSPISGLYSGEFNNEPLDVVLDGIGYASNFRFNIDGKFVTIKN